MRIIRLAEMLICGAHCRMESESSRQPKLSLVSSYVRVMLKFDTLKLLRFERLHRIAWGSLIP